MCENNLPLKENEQRDQYESISYRLFKNLFLFLSNFFLQKSRASSYWIRSACYIPISCSLLRPTFGAILHRNLLSRSWESEERSNRSMKFAVNFYLKCYILWFICPKLVGEVMVHLVCFICERLCYQRVGIVDILHMQ